MLSALFHARDQGVRCMVQGGIDPDEWSLQWEVKRLAQEHCPEVSVVPCFGLHPWWVADPKRTEADLEEGLAQLHDALSLRESPRPAEAGGEFAVALGEIGLDASKRLGGGSGPAWERQLLAFEKQWAIRTHFPVVLHLVGPKAHREALKRVESIEPGMGIIHRFSADASVGREWIDRGFLLSLGPELLRSPEPFSLDSLPDAALVFESDAPQKDRDGRIIGPELREAVIQKYREKRH